MRTENEMKEWQKWYDEIIACPRPNDISDHQHIENMHNHPDAVIEVIGSYHFYVETADQMKGVLQKFDEIDTLERMGLAQVALFFENGEMILDRDWQDGGFDIDGDDDREAECLFETVTSFRVSSNDHVTDPESKLSYYFDPIQREKLDLKSIVIPEDFVFPCLVAFSYDNDSDRIGSFEIVNANVIPLVTESLKPGWVYLK